MSNRRGSTLRRALRAHDPARGKRYGAALKRRVIAFAEAERKSGRSWSEISKELGIAFETVRRWCMPTRAVGRMRVVHVVAEPSAKREVTVLAPSGHRVEGLSLDEAAALLRALG
jgi:predicted transcriptional regulator